MKKLLCLFLAVFIIVFSLSSCSETPTVTEPSSQMFTQFEILEIGGYDHNSEANHSKDILLTTSAQISNDAIIQHRKILCNDVEYELSYQMSYATPYYRDSCDEYHTQTEDVIITIAINRETGKMDNYHFYNKNYLKDTTLTKRTQDECFSIAKEYFATYIEDGEKYELTDEAFIAVPDVEGFYRFLFTRTVDGIQTSDNAVIWVTIHGKVILHDFCSLGHMRNAVLPAHETMDAIQAGLDNRLDEIYSPVMDKYTVSYKPKGETFVRLADGTYALKYDFEVRATPKSNNGNPWGEGAHFLVRLS